MIEVLKQAYQLLLTEPHAPTVCNQLEVIFRQAIAELESQEPVAWRYGALLYHDKLDAMEFIRTSGDSYLLEPLYTHPPQRTWEELTDEERQDIALEVPMDAVLITEAKLKQLNT